MKLYDDQYIVVTGGAGFIGSGVIKALNEKGFHNLVIVDRLGEGERWRNLVGKRFLEIVDIEALWEWLKGRESQVEAIIHLGACSSTVEKDASYLLSNNTHYTIRLAEWALNNDVRFIYASSAATYGDGTLGFADHEKQLHTLQPLNMYGYSKHLFDLWAHDHNVLEKMAGLKYFNVFGPNESHKGRMASALVHMLPQIQKEGVIRLFQSNDPAHFGDGEQMRDFIYVKDAVKMTLAFLENELGGIYNIGNGVPHTWNQMAKALFKALEKEPRIEYIPMPDDLKGIYQNYTCADMEKARQALGKSAQCLPLEESVRDYVQNYLVAGKRW